MFKKTSRGKESRSRKVLRRTAAAVAAAAVLPVAFTASAATAGPAYAIDNPDPFSCAWNTTFGADDYFHLKIANFGTGQLTPLCYENSGTEWNMDVENVWGIHSGNNAGLIETSCATTCQIWAYPKWYDDSNYWGTVIMLTIY